MAQEVTLDGQTKSSDALSPAPVAEDRLLVGIAGHSLNLRLAFLQGPWPVSLAGTLWV